MKMLNQLWKDEAGAVLSIEFVLMATIIGLGMMVGLSSVRDSVDGELADVAYAIGSFNQTYSAQGITGHSAATGNSGFLDSGDFCEGTGASNAACQTIGTASITNNPTGTQGGTNN
jgi:Flp pilus assembly pilin Flp